MTVEEKRWSQYSEKSEAILYYFLGFFNMREAKNPAGTISKKCINNLKCLIRMISWVESKHGKAGANQPTRDPMQTGNPGDAWWKELTGQSGRGSRFVGGPGHPNYWAKQLCKAFIKDLKARIKRLENANKKLIKKPGGLPSDRFFEVLRSNERYIIMYSHWLRNIQWSCSAAAKKSGHRNAKFEPCMSFFWGTLYLLHKIRRGPFYKIDCQSCEKLITKAIDYNGGGDPKYGEKLRQTHKEIGCCKDS
ncbi:MAG: hypothetical protein IID52_05850 [Proteobacteria bacterium]|nr:hypothetical protein [Pseudomonadota bacterium]